MQKSRVKQDSDKNEFALAPQVDTNGVENVRNMQ